MPESVDPAITSVAAETGAEPLDQGEKPRRGDKAPKPRGKRKASAAQREAAAKGGASATMKARTRTLAKELGELLTFPAVPAAMVAPDPATQAYMIEHFTRSGPTTAQTLAHVSESNPRLRAVLEQLVTGGGMFTVALALVSYGAPPIMWAIGMRVQAARMTEATTMDEAGLAAMMQAAADAAAAQTAAAENGQGAPGSPGAAPATGADSLAPE